MKKVSPETPATDLPLHKQVERTIRDWMTSGKYGSGDQLPPARELSQLLQINEQTVRRALKHLMEEGLLRGAQGKGVFISETGTKHRRIALVLPNLEDELTVQIAQGAQEIFDAAGCSGLILDARRESEKEEQNIRSLTDLPIDGALIFPIAFGNIGEHVVGLKARGLPLVLVDKELPGVEVSCVRADDYDGMYQLTCELIKRGCRRFGWLSGEEGSSTVEQRLDGFRWALGDHGIPLARQNVRRLSVPSPTADYRASLETEIAALLALPERPHTIVCANDLLALDAMRVLQAQGLRVPQDIAVAGFDDLKGGVVSVPTLTTVHKPIRDLGARAAELLLRHINHRSTPVARLVLPTSPVLRDSTQ